MKVHFVALFILMDAALGNRELNDNFCNEFDTNGACVSCQKGYWLHEGTCVHCIYAVDKCTDCTQDGSACLECEAGFISINEEKCALCINYLDQCEVCDRDAQKCFKCFEPWQLKDGVCVSPGTTKFYEVYNQEQIWNTQTPNPNIGFDSETRGQDLRGTVDYDPRNTPSYNGEKTPTSIGGIGNYSTREKSADYSGAASGGHSGGAPKGYSGGAPGGHSGGAPGGYSGGAPADYSGGGSVSYGSGGSGGRILEENSRDLISQSDF